MIAIKNLIVFVLLISIATLLHSCSKADVVITPSSNAIPGTSASAALIVGKWKVTSDNNKIYGATSGVLVKDTTTNYITDPIGKMTYWYFEYRANGKFFVLSRDLTKFGTNIKYNDTLTRYNYRINGNKIELYIGSRVDETDEILQLNTTTLQTTNTYIGKPSSGYGLDMNANYKFVSKTTYARQ